ncbi:MAG: S-adenosylmethionine:tRNA ribosyltransferase-isomerase, partial [Bdellovibrionales bacterium]|nr:S-adenosylmethionine:tRNA ribosyltransferase-isomerase [Bdellovibrionales bacterium]
MEIIHAIRTTMHDNTNPDLLLSSYHYDLPPELIAQRPIHESLRHQSRLLVYNALTDKVTHDHFYNLPNYLP